MKLTASLLVLSFFCASLVPVAPSGSSSASQAEAAQQVNFKKIINGKDNPSLIADTVAYDVFFRSLTFSPQESAAVQSRLRALADKMGITVEEASAIRAAAEEFSQSVAALDVQAAEIKEKHLPNLTPGDASQLTGLQKQKEALITSTVASNSTRLGRQLADKLLLHIVGYVKPRVRSLQPPTPDHQHDSLSHKNAGSPRFIKTSYAPAQTYNGLGVGGYGHLYVDGWQDTAAGAVYGQGLVTEDYNSYSHMWSVNTRIYNPDGTRSQSRLIEWYRAASSSTTSLPILDDFGDFFIEIEIKQKCPYIFGLIALGIFLLDPPVTVPPGVEVGFHKVFLQAPSDPEALESAAFASDVFGAAFTNIVNFNISTTQGPAACEGESFIIQASFVPPQDSAFCCNLTRISLFRDNKFEKSPNPVTGFTEGIFINFVLRESFVAVRLRRRLDANGMKVGTTNSVNISISGRLGNGQPYPGRAIVRLVCP